MIDLPEKAHWRLVGIMEYLIFNYFARIAMNIKAQSILLNLCKKMDIYYDQNNKSGRADRRKRVLYVGEHGVAASALIRKGRI